MNREILIVYAVLAGAAILFLTNRIRNDLVALLVMLALMVSGVLTVAESLAGFADPVVMIIVAMFIVSQALVNTGIAQRIGEMVMTAGRGSEMRLVVMLMLAVAGVGAFMSSTAAVAIACSAAYVTPVSSPVNMMVLEPGGYSFMDFVKVGIPLLFLSLIATVAQVGAIYRR